MSKKPPTPVEEIIAQVKKSTLKTLIVFVEGPDDVEIYREIAYKKGITSVSFEGRGGRIALFRDFPEVKNSGHLDEILFFADKDFYCFDEKVPSEYQAINFTQGYSIENDLFVDGQRYIDSELRPDEKPRFEKLLNNVCRWFVFELDQKSEDRKISETNLQNELIIAPLSNNLSASFLSNRGQCATENKLYIEIRSNFSVKLRGKFLFQILFRIIMDSESRRLRPDSTPKWWGICISEGISVSISNCNRIANIINSRLILMHG